MVPRLKRDVGAGSAKPRVLLVDDHPGILAQVSALLAGDFDVVGTATDGHQALAVAGQLDPDAIVLDINMPGCDGFQTMRALKQAQSRAAVVFLSMLDDEEPVCEAVRLGARAYVVKPYMMKRLASALDQALLGRLFLPSLTSWLEGEFESRHAVHLFGSEASFADTLASVFHAALRRGDAACLTANERLRQSVRERLRARGWDIGRSSGPNRYREVDAADALNSFMRDGLPDADRISVMVQELDDFRRAFTDGGQSRLVIGGCLAGALSAEGNVAGALALERIWNDLTHDRPFLTVCGYASSCFHDAHPELWTDISAEHGIVSHANDR
jgi:DNA-binding NarL/FixJ family response regulator